jgi:hypothetical protein
VAKRKAKNNNGAPSGEKATATQEKPADEPAKTDIPLPGADRGVAAPQPNQQPNQPEVKELSLIDKARLESFLAQKALIAEKEKNLKLQQEILALRQENLKLQSQQLGQAKQDTEGEQTDFLQTLGISDSDRWGVREGKLLVQRGAAQ